MRYLIFVLILLTSCSTPDLPFYTSIDLTPQIFSVENRSDIHTVSDFKFVNQNGDTLTNKNLSGKIYFADFMFTKCQSICIPMTDGLVRAQNSFLKGTDVRILSFTVDPKNDTVEAFKKYAVENGADETRWDFLTGKKQDLYTLATESFFAGQFKYIFGKNDFIHSENVYLVDPNSHIRGVYDGTELKELERMEKDLQTLQNEFKL